MTLIVAVDPGKMTGVALFETQVLPEPTLIASHEFERDDLEVWLEEMLVPTPIRRIEVVAERYVLSDLDAPWSLKYLGVLSYLSRKGGWGEPTIQTPADAKSFATDERIRQLGFWHRGGAGHANDAIRHGVLYMVRKQLISARSLVID